LAPSAAGST